MKTTSKKQKFVGVRKLIDADTGEAIPAQLTEIEDRDFNFHKVWMQHLILSLSGISNKKIELAFWIIDNLNNDNMLIASQRDIAIKTGLSLNTVTLTMKALQEGEIPFLRKVQSGVYQVNPEVLFKGKHNKRMAIVFDYSKNMTSVDGDENKKNESEK